MKDGRNLAFYKEHDDSDEGSFFIHGAFSDFSGGYWHDSQFGYRHWAMHEDVPGQKFFRWPLSGAGARLPPHGAYLGGCACQKTLDSDFVLEV
jgi:hypothetical protein